ncbi:MAG: PRC-barrel domain-containing protein [Candidatus Micrarchaeia archaeon]
MSKYMIAKQVAGKRLITNDGEELGRLVDINVNEVTGKIESLVIEPNLDNKTARKMGKQDGMIVLPYKSVLAISDHIIVQKKDLL